MSTLPAIAPHVPTIASQGLTSVLGSWLSGRLPSLSSRMKQSCRLANFVFFASLRSTSQKKRQMAIEMSRMSGRSILLNQPIRRVARRLGIRFVSAKLRTSCWSILAMRSRTVIWCHSSSGRVRHHGFAIHHVHALCPRRNRGCCRVARDQVAFLPHSREAPFARWPCPHGPPHRFAGAILCLWRGRFFPFRWGSRGNRLSPSQRVHAHGAALCDALC